MYPSSQTSLSITNSQSLPKLMFIESVMPSNHLILCHPLLPLPSIFSNISSVQFSRSVVSNSLGPHGLQPTRLLHPWDFLGKSTRVGCHCLLRYILLKNVKINNDSVQFSHSVVSDSLQPHEPQHARLPCPSPTPGIYPNSRPLRW